MGKTGVLSNFEHGMVVSTSVVGLSMSETADPLGFLQITISRFYREWSKKEKLLNERQFSG